METASENMKAIWIYQKDYDKLVKMKIHPREPFSDVIKRVLESPENCQKSD